MKFNLNGDFHGEINYFPSLVHQYKMMWGRILPPPDETGMNVDLQLPFETQWKSAQRLHFPLSVCIITVIISCSVAFLSAVCSA